MIRPALTEGIARNLYDFSYGESGEGFEAAMAKAEHWRDVLVEMLEVASTEPIPGQLGTVSQQVMVSQLLDAVKLAIVNMLHESARIADSIC